MDGVYYENDTGQMAFKKVTINDQDICQLVKKIKIRIDRAFIKRGLMDGILPEEIAVNNHIDENSQLELLKAQSVSNLVDGFKKPKAIGKWGNPPFKEFSGKKCASLDGYSLHANVFIPANRRSDLEKLCRYILEGHWQKREYL